MSMKRTIQRSMCRHKMVDWPSKTWPSGHIRSEYPAGVRKHRKRMKPYLGVRGITRLQRSLRRVGKAAEKTWIERTWNWLMHIEQRKRK